MKKLFRAADLALKPIERATTIPSSWYVSPEIFPLDLDSVFAPSWQYIGHQGALSKPGDYISSEVAGNPVLAVRGRDGVDRAFYNVCRHRGGPIVTTPSGTCGAALQCKYHGWTYTLDGVLRGVPRFDRVDLFDKKDFGLVPIRLAAWGGLLFVQLKKGMAPPETLLEPVFSNVSPEIFSARKFFRRTTYDIECNWKVYVDNYLEGYHLPFVHPELCDLLDYRQYVTETFPCLSLQYSPFTGKETVYGSGEGAAYYYFLFPNFMINLLPGRMQTNLVEPLGPDRTRVVFDYYYDDIESSGALQKIEDDISYSDRVQAEDVGICTLVQKGLKSAAYDRGRYSVDMEQAVYHFQSLLRKIYKKSSRR